MRVLEAADVALIAPQVIESDEVLIDERSVTTPAFSDCEDDLGSGGDDAANEGEPNEEKRRIEETIVPKKPHTFDILYHGAFLGMFFLTSAKFETFVFSAFLASVTFLGSIGITPWRSKWSNWSSSLKRPLQVFVLFSQLLSFQVNYQHRWLLPLVVPVGLVLPIWIPYHFWDENRLVAFTICVAIRSVVMAHVTSAIQRYLARKAAEPRWKSPWPKKEA